MVAPGEVICPATRLVDGGDGFRFEVDLGHGLLQAFAVRHHGRVVAYLNRCAHIPVELDWQPGHFFDDTGNYLICATHGATYDPASGACLAGPCRGARLIPVPVLEQDGMIRLSACLITSYG